MTRTLATCSILALTVMGCADGTNAHGGLMSTMGLTSGVSKTSYGATVHADDDASGEENWDFWGGVFSPGAPIDVSDGALMGDYGFHTIADSMTASVEGYSDGPWTEVNLMVETSNGVSMAIFEAWDGLEQLETGVTRTFDRWDSEINGAYVSVIGCAGRVAYEWDYDDAAMTVEVAVTADPTDATQRIYAFTAYFDPSSGGQTTVLSGRFVGP